MMNDKEHQSSVRWILMAIYITLLAIFIATISISAHAQEDFGTIYQGPSNAYVFLGPETALWPNAHIPWRYKTNGLMDEDVLLDALTEAMGKIERRSSLTFELLGSSSRDVTGASSSPPLPGQLLIEVIDKDEMHAKYGPYSGVAWLWYAGGVTGAEIAFVDTDGCMPALHELLHVLNLGHSDSYNSVMSVPGRGCEYKKTLRTDDINGLHSLYPLDRPVYEAELIGASEHEACIYVPMIYALENYYSFSVCIPLEEFSQVFEEQPL